jgi:hypothetical protein
MINRRSFFKSIGSTILGTAITLRLGSLVPIPIIEATSFQFSYTYLNGLFERAKLESGGKEPDLLININLEDYINWV